MLLMTLTLIAILTIATLKGQNHPYVAAIAQMGVLLIPIPFAIHKGLKWLSTRRKKQPVGFSST
jgi:hypothetical protein